MYTLDTQLFSIEKDGFTESKRGAQGETAEASPALPVVYANGLFFPYLSLSPIVRCAELLGRFKNRCDFHDKYS